MDELDRLVPRLPLAAQRQLHRPGRLVLPVPDPLPGEEALGLPLLPVQPVAAPCVGDGDGLVGVGGDLVWAPRERDAAGLLLDNSVRTWWSLEAAMGGIADRELEHLREVCATCTVIGPSLCHDAET